MNANENTRTNAPEDVIELGLASIETKGSPLPGNEGQGRAGEVGISE